MDAGPEAVISGHRLILFAGTITLSYAGFIRVCIYSVRKRVAVLYLACKQRICFTSAYG